jgi:hypothetical protein
LSIAFNEWRLPYIVAGNVAIDEIFDLKKVDVIFRVGFFAGAGKHDAFVVVTDSLKKFPHFRKRSHLGEIFVSEQLGAVIIQRFAETLDLIGRKKFR